MIKSLIRAGLAGACRTAGMVARAERRNRAALTILCYHRVLPRDRKGAYHIPDLVVTPEGLEAHCAVLARHYDVLPLAEAMTRLESRQVGSKPLAAITFDDGYRDNAVFAAPALEAHGLRGTFFIIAGLVEKEEGPWYDRLGRAARALRDRGALERLLADGPLCDSDATPAALVRAAKALPPAERAAFVDGIVDAAGGDPLIPEQDLIMTWQDLGRLASKGHEIGAHTVSHELLPLLDDDALAYEIADSKRILEEGLGRPVTSFCYPNGDYDARTLQLVGASGYRYACTVKEGLVRPGAAPFELRRWFIHEERLNGAPGAPSPTLLRMELSGLADRVFRRNRSEPVTT